MRNSCRMKISRILYKRNSSVNHKLCMKGRDSGLEWFRTKGTQERREKGKKGYRKERIQERRETGKEVSGQKVCGTGEMLEIFMRGGMHIWFSNGANDQCFFARCCSFVSFRLLNVLFQSFAWKTSFVKQEISRNMSNFSRNTKLALHEIFENFVWKKLECQPY